MGQVTEGLLARFDAAAARLEVFAAAHTRSVSNDEWDAGQIWAHVAEFLVHWREELGLRVAGRVSDPIGRGIDDPERLGAIDRDHFVPRDEMLHRIRPAIAAARDFIASIPEDTWDKPIDMVNRGTVTFRQAAEQA